MHSHSDYDDEDDYVPLSRRWGWRQTAWIGLSALDPTSGFVWSDGSSVSCHLFQVLKQGDTVARTVTENF